MFSKIENLCKEKNISLYRFSKETGISEQTLSMLKKRNGDLSVQNIAKVAQYFDLPIEYFVSSKGD